MLFLVMSIFVLGVTLCSSLLYCMMKASTTSVQGKLSL
jgi:hypothetical protein